MRVCIITIAAPAHGIGGMQDHTDDLACGLVRAGHEVEVITSRHPANLPEERRDGVLWRFIDAPGHQNHRVWLRKSYEEFVRLHAERPFDVIHSESSCAVEHVRRGVHRRVPLVAMFHGVLLGFARAGLARGLRARRPLPLLRELKHIAWIAGHEHFRHGNWWRFRACEAIVPSAQQLDDTIRSCLLKRSRVHVVPNGINADLFRPRPRQQARSELGIGPEPVLVSVGRLNFEKGVHHAIAAVARLQATTPNVRLFIVGDGEERARLENLARDLGVAERVTFTGAQPHAVVAAYLAAADVFLFPTERDEAAPLVLPQAMSSGRPVIASRVGAIPDAINRPGENGLLVRPGDVVELAETIQHVLADEALRTRLGSAARRRVLEEYTIERMTERTLEVYRIAALRLRDDRAASVVRPAHVSSRSLPQTFGDD